MKYWTLNCLPPWYFLSAQLSSYYWKMKGHSLFYKRSSIHKLAFWTATAETLPLNFDTAAVSKEVQHMPPPGTQQFKVHIHHHHFNPFLELAQNRTIRSLSLCSFRFGLLPSNHPFIHTSRSDSGSDLV